MPRADLACADAAARLSPARSNRAPTQPGPTLRAPIHPALTQLRPYAACRGPARPDSARPDSARPGTARPGTARPGTARPSPGDAPAPSLPVVPDRKPDRSLVVHNPARLWTSGETAGDHCPERLVQVVRRHERLVHDIRRRPRRSCGGLHGVSIGGGGGDHCPERLVQVVRRLERVVHDVPAIRAEAPEPPEVSENPSAKPTPAWVSANAPQRSAKSRTRPRTPPTARYPAWAAPR
jgi:hypothetical protein